MGANGRSDAAANLTYTKFLFVLPHLDDAATLTKIRGAGSNISRGFFNDYDADGTRDPQPQETIQFLSADPIAAGAQGIGAARFVAHVSANYRPRLDEVANELKRRINGAAEIVVLDGAERMPRYTQRRDAEVCVQARARAAVRPRRAELRDHADEQDRGLVGEVGARAALVLLSAPRRRQRMSRQRARESR